MAAGRSGVGHRFSAPPSSSAISACIPSWSSPHWGQPMARAPVRVAMAKAWAPPRAVGSPVKPFCSREARRISLSMSSRLLLEAPSVPRATLTPAWSILHTGAKPLANFMLLAGLCTAHTPFSARMAMSSSSTWTQWAARVGLSNRPRSRKYRTGLTPWRWRQPSTSPWVSDRWM